MATGHELRVCLVDYTGPELRRAGVSRGGTCRPRDRRRSMCCL